MQGTAFDEVGRPLPPAGADEAATLLGFLDFQRATLAWKCSGLTDDQLRIAVPPSSMTLGGLLKHVASAEDAWFTRAVGGRPMPDPWAAADAAGFGLEWSWTSAAADTGDSLRALWSERVERSRAIVNGVLQERGEAALGDMHESWAGRVSLRWIIAHMIEEYARHNGHADLLREAVDGATGE